MRFKKLNQKMFLAFIVSICAFVGLSGSIVQTQVPIKAQIAFVSHRDGNSGIYVMDADVKDIRRLTDQSANYVYPSWSPDGKKIAFASTRDGGSTDWRIYVMDANGQNLQKLTNFWGDWTSPTWSPDGSKIAFTSARDFSEGVYIMDANGQNVRKITDLLGCRSPSWSPNGQQIAFAANPGFSNVDIYLIDPDGKNLRNLTNHPAYDSEPSWFPDGRQIVFTSTRDNGGPAKVRREIYVMDADGGNIRRLTNNQGLEVKDWTPSWSPDGKQIIFASNRGGRKSEIHVMDADGNNVRKLTDTPPARGWEYSFGPVWFDPSFVRSFSVSPADKLKAIWGRVKQNIK